MGKLYRRSWAFPIDHEKLKEKYKTLLKDCKFNSKDSRVEISPKHLIKIEHNQKQVMEKQIAINSITENYPSLVFDYMEQKAFLNKNEMNLSPKEDEIRDNLKEIQYLFSNYDNFIGDHEKLKNTHFKLLNAILSSPFNAKIRCTAMIKNVPTSSLPLFTLISSETSNSGKTFIVKTALKLMTGKNLSGFKASDYGKKQVEEIQVGGVEGIPFFIDEIDNKYIAQIRGLIKDPEKCEKNQLEKMPMLIFASNDVLKPEEPLRKRMVFFCLDAALSSELDKTSFEGRGKKILNSLGTAFYREYLRRMLLKVKDLLDFIIYSDDIPDDYYPDIMKISSETIKEIFDQYSDETPKYVRILSFREDYSSDANAESALQEICDFIKNNPKNVKITRELVTIEVGTDRNSVNRLKSWKNILPAEMKVTEQSSATSFKIRMRARELKEKLKKYGFSIKKHSWFNFL